MDLALMAAELERDEGVRLYAYMDTTGNRTVGVGRNLDANPLTTDELTHVGHDARLKPITHEQALYLLRNDIQRTSLELNRRMHWWTNLDEVRQRVLLNMAFNLGVPRLLAFTETLRWTEQGHYNAAAQCRLQSVWANQVGQRAERLAQMMRTGEVK